MFRRSEKCSEQNSAGTHMVYDVFVMRAVKIEEEPYDYRTAEKADGDLPRDHPAADEIDPADQEKHRRHRADRLGCVSEEKVKCAHLGNGARHKLGKRSLDRKLTHHIPIRDDSDLELLEDLGVRGHHTRKDKEGRKRNCDRIDDSAEKSAYRHRDEDHDRDHKVINSRGHKHCNDHTEGRGGRYAGTASEKDSKDQFKKRTAEHCDDNDRYRARAVYDRAPDYGGQCRDKYIEGEKKLAVAASDMGSG